MQKYIVRYRAQLPPNQTLTFTDAAIDCRAEILRSREAPIGNFIADALREHCSTDAALYNGGGIRGDCILPEGVLTVRDIETMLPFDNKAVVVTMSGGLLRQTLERSVAQLPLLWGGFLQISGLKISVAAGEGYNPGTRITDIDVLGADGLYCRLDPSRHYRVAINSFLARGGNGYEEFKEARAEPSAGTAVRDIIMERMAAQPRLLLATDGRITITASGRRH